MTEHDEEQEYDHLKRLRAALFDPTTDPDSEDAEAPARRNVVPREGGTTPAILADEDERETARLLFTD